MDTITIGLLIPFMGTLLGSATVFLLRDKMGNKFQKFLLGFASGVMIAASVWSLIIPSMDMTGEDGIMRVVPAAVGFLLGMGFLLLLDMVTPHLHFGSKSPEGPKAKLSRTAMLTFAVALHNLPEGIAVGVVLASSQVENTTVTITMAIALAIGIAIQNFPEGAIVSLSMNASGVNKKKAFGLGVLSGVVEPLGAILTVLLVDLLNPALPYLLSFAAGAMLYVVVEELVPEMSKGEHSHFGTIMFGIGFALMLILEVVLG